MLRRCMSGHHPRRPPAAARDVRPRDAQSRFDFDTSTWRRRLHRDALDRDQVQGAPQRRRGAHRATNSELITCSHEKQSALFYAAVSGLRCIGLIVTVQLSLKSAFHPCEVQETVPYDDVVDDLHAIPLRRWWYPQGQQRRSNSQSPGTSTSSPTSGCPKASSRSLHPASSMMRLPPCSRPSFWRALLTLHLVEMLLFIARWPPWLTYYVARCALWMDSARKVTVDDSTSILNLNCRVRNSFILTRMPGSSLTCRSTRFYSPVLTMPG